MRGVAWIVNVAEETDQRTPTISAFMQIVFAENYRAGPPQPLNYFRVLGGNSMLENRAGRGFGRARGIDQVFQCDRNPMQRPTPFSAGDFDFGSLRLRQRRHGGHGDEGVEFMVE